MIQNQRFLLGTRQQIAAALSDSRRSESIEEGGGKSSIPTAGYIHMSPGGSVLERDSGIPEGMRSLCKGRDTDESLE